MKKPIHPYFHFDEYCKVAMQFNRWPFGDALELWNAEDSPLHKHYSEVIYHPLFNMDLKQEKSRGRIIPENIRSENCSCLFCVQSLSV